MQLSARASVGFSMTVARVSVVKRARLTHGVASSPARQCPSSRCPLVARASEREQSLDRDSDTLKADAELRMTEIIAQLEAKASGDSLRTPGANGTDIASLRIKVDRALAAMNHGLVEREAETRLLLLAALCGEHVLYLGPPGTAKSEMSRRLHAVLDGGGYFERLLTRFSVPEELFGPLSMRALERDLYLRNTEGYLPQADVAFVDEVFKANSAILNTLLTLLNERLFDNGNQRLPVPLVCMVAASNELPESEELDALYDRFLVRKQVRQVSAAGLSTLLTSRSNNGAAPPALAAATAAEVLTVDDVRAVAKAAAEQVSVPMHVTNLLVDLRTFLQDKVEPPVYVSDRRLVKALALLQVSAYTNGRDTVTEHDCLLLQHVMWSRPEDCEKIYDWLLSNMSVDSEMRQSNYLLASLFGRTCHSLQDEEKLAQIRKEMAMLNEVLLEKLQQCVLALSGVPSVQKHMWIPDADMAAVSAALTPKLQKTLRSLQTTTFELVTLELAVERRADAVVLANLMPRYWADFIRSSSDKDARELGTVPFK